MRLGGGGEGGREGYKDHIQLNTSSFLKRPDLLINAKVSLIIALFETKLNTLLPYIKM